MNDPHDAPATIARTDQAETDKQRRRHIRREWRRIQAERAARDAQPAVRLADGPEGVGPQQPRILPDGAAPRREPHPRVL